MIKGPLGLLVWADTLHDDVCIKPIDLINVDTKEARVELALDEPKELSLIAA